jgi:hypothetical protein
LDAVVACESARGKRMWYVDVDEASPVAAKGPVVVFAEALGQLVCAVHCAEGGGGCGGLVEGNRWEER